MSFFGKLKKVADIVTLGGVTFFEQQVEIGGRLLDATIDVKNQIVRIGEDVFRAAPGELFFPGVGPLAGILKNEIEDELILLSPLGIVTSIDVYFPVDPLGTIIVVGDLLGVIRHRTMVAEEREIARYVFGDQLKQIDEIRLTSLVGLDGNPFAAPMHAGGATVNLGDRYRHDTAVENIPLLMHELAHVWQLDHSLLEHLAVCEGLFEAGRDTIGQDVYSFQPGLQWFEYGVEQQASIVEAWARGATRRPNKNFDEGSVDIFTINSPVFRYINGNIRRGRTHAPTRRGGSLRTLLADGGHRTVRAMLQTRPRVTWPPNIR
jgi:hypothetical protein